MILSDKNLFPDSSYKVYSLIASNWYLQTQRICITAVVITFVILTYTSNIAHTAQCTSCLQMKPNLAVFWWSWYTILEWIPFQTQPIHLMKAHDKLENYIATTKIRFWKFNIMLFDVEGYIATLSQSVIHLMLFNLKSYISFKILEKTRCIL